MRTVPIHKNFPGLRRIAPGLALLLGVAVAGLTMVSVAWADIYRCLNSSQEESFSNVRCEEFGYITLEKMEGASEVKGTVVSRKGGGRSGDCYGVGMRYGMKEMRWEEVPEECLAVPDFLAGWEEGLQKKPKADRMREACEGLCADYGRRQGADNLQVCIEECVRDAAGRAK